jgi:fatty-acyl-CoA synthase
VNARDVYLQTQPLFHCNGWGLPYGLAAMGARQVMQRKVDGPEILRRVAAEGVTLTACAPAVHDAILAAGVAARERGEETPQRGRMRVITGGASPATSTIRRVEEELGWEVIHGYGLTESSPVLTLNRGGPELDGLDPEERATRLARQGMEVIGVRIRVDQHGEVLARSNHVLEGYWDDPEASAQARRESSSAHHRPQEGRHRLRRRKRLLDRGRRLLARSPGRHRGRRDRRSPRAVGRDGEGPRRARSWRRGV